MPGVRPGLRVGLIEPHLRRYGGIRRVLEFSNRLVARGHQVTFYLPDDQILNCSWMRCDAAIKTLSSGFDDPLDILVFNHEPHWHLLDRFTQARRRIFYALHYSRTYQKAGSWESIRTPVDLQLANSNWTADQIEAEIGSRPVVQLGGANREVFHPYGATKKYPILSVGDSHRVWKGHETILEAARMLDLPVEAYAPKDLSQADLGREYDAASVFVVGSWFEGFCQPGLEAMACGVPLVTTDNGGCREYAIDGETALVVPPGDPVAMANAIRRLLNDEVLAKQLVANGLDLVERDFDWERRTDELAEVLDGVSAGTALSPPPPRPTPPDRPELSVVTLAWDNLPYTQDFVESVRQNTDVDYELIIVDNGSAWEAANYGAAAADTSVLNDTNLGFAVGMNQGLAVARAPYVAFCNNDTILPPGWASKLVQTARDHPRAGIVVPALTAANNADTVRTEPGTDVVVLPPFSAPPGAVLYLMPTDVVTGIERWGEEYEVASGEDVDLAFKVWVNDLDIVYDQRVLVDHVGKGSASRLKDWKGLWAKNRQHFLDKWTGDTEVPRLDSCDPERFARNRATAAAAAAWMAKYFKARDRAPTVRKIIESSPGGGSRARYEQQRTQAVAQVQHWRRRGRKELGRNLRRVKRRSHPRVIRWARSMLQLLPASVEDTLRAITRGTS
jgi:glycosyltransferase involved in cell wall biosynthesis/GT2 family glycosyltransferase